MENPDHERAVKWLPVDDLPHSPCHVWRVRTDVYFDGVVEGEFAGDSRTLQIQFSHLQSISAVNDMLGIGMHVREIDRHLPMLDDESYRWPTVEVENSEWIQSNGLLLDGCADFVLFSLECTVEVAAKRATARWL